MNLRILLLALICCSFRLSAQEPYTASFVAKLGSDTVIVETYNMLFNHLYGKAFLRYPEDQVAVFNFHFYPDGSIQHYSISFMNPDSSFVTSSGTQGLKCANDSCTWFGAFKGGEGEYENTRAVKSMHFIGGWTPTMSLIEWHCMRLVKSGQASLPLTMINDYIGIREVGVSKGKNDSLIFGGPFLEYAKIAASKEGRILHYDGTGTPWNYIVTKHPPIDVDVVAKRLSKTKKIGIPSPEVDEFFPIANDTIQLSYGRPSKRGRLIFGGIVPFDSLWRTGAGRPTRITFPFDVQFDKTIIPKGSYSIYTIPRTGDWILIFNTDLQQWPTDPNRNKDFASVSMKWRKPSQAVDPSTIRIEPTKEGGVILFSWDNTEAYAPFRIRKK